MYPLFIGGIVLVAFMALLKGIRRRVVDPHYKTFRDSTGLYQINELNRNGDALPASCLQTTPYFTEHP